MVSEDKVDRVALTLKVKELKSQIQNLEKIPSVTGLDARLDELKKSSGDGALLRNAQNQLQLWNRIHSGLHNLLEMMDLVAPPDHRSLDEDRCNWWILQEDADELEQNLNRFTQQQP